MGQAGVPELEYICGIAQKWGLGISSFIEHLRKKRRKPQRTGADSYLSSVGAKEEKPSSQKKTFAKKRRNFFIKKPHLQRVVPPRGDELVGIGRVVGHAQHSVCVAVHLVGAQALLQEGNDLRRGEEEKNIL